MSVKNRRRMLYMVTDEEKVQEHLIGDYASEGLLDHFRKAEIIIPTCEIAYYATKKNDLDWYAMEINAGLSPPEQQKVSWLKVIMKFKEPIKKLGGWYPDDVFSNYK